MSSHEVWARVAALSRRYRQIFSVGRISCRSFPWGGLGSGHTTEGRSGGCEGRWVVVCGCAVGLCG